MMNKRELLEDLKGQGIELVLPAAPRVSPLPLDPAVFGLVSPRFRFLGIDPGKSGAIASIDVDGKDPLVFAIPLIDKKVYDFEGVMGLLTERLAPGVAEGQFWNLSFIGAAVERMQPLPVSLGGAYANFGRGESLAWEWLFRSMRIPVVRPMPVQWQKKAFLGACEGDTKTRSILEAQRRWPGLDLHRTPRSHKLDDGFSDALHLANYAREHFQGSK